MEEEEKLKCPCGWEGTEDELEIDFYESHTSSMPLGSNCPKCKNEVE